MAEPTFYILLGNAVDAERWRRKHQVPQRQVIRVNSIYDTQRLRGLAGPIEVVTLHSWEPSVELSAEVLHCIRLIEATTPVQPGSDTRSYPPPTDQGGPQ